MDQLDDVRTWRCMYCQQLIPIREDLYVEKTNHLLDEHRARLLVERPLLLRDSR